MPIRFWRRFKIFPGVWLNISKSGISFSFGVRGAKYTKSRAGSRMTFGLPDSGLSHTTFYSKKKQQEIKEKQRKEQTQISDAEIQEILDEVNGK